MVSDNRDLTAHTNLGSGNGVNKGGLLEAVVAGSHGHLPARIDGIVDHLPRHLLLCLALVSLHIQLHVVLETLHLQSVSQSQHFTRDYSRYKSHLLQLESFTAAEAISGLVNPLSTTCVCVVKLFTCSQSVTRDYSRCKHIKFHYIPTRVFHCSRSYLVNPLSTTCACVVLA